MLNRTFARSPVVSLRRNQFAKDCGNIENETLDRAKRLSCIQDVASDLKAEPGTFVAGDWSVTAFPGLSSRNSCSLKTAVTPAEVPVGNRKD
jgi:hypothetical protein